MNFHVIGVNHNSAPLEVRERLAVPEAQLPDAIRSLVQQPGVDEGMVLSTCNRVEVVTSTKQGADLRGFLGSYFGVNPSALNSHIYEFEQREAVHRLGGIATRIGFGKTPGSEPFTGCQFRQVFLFLGFVGERKNMADTE